MNSPVRYTPKSSGKKCVAFDGDGATVQLTQDIKDRGRLTITIQRGSMEESITEESVSLERAEAQALSERLNRWLKTGNLYDSKEYPW